MTRRLACAALAGLGCAAVLGPASVPAYASFVFDVNESVFNTLLAASGSLSGSGQKRITANVPCFPDVWHTCTITVYDGSYTWSVTNPRVDISASGPRFLGHLNFSYAGLNFSEDITAPVDFTLSDSELRIRINQVSIPVNLNIPPVGNVRITTVRVDPNIDIVSPIGAFGLVTDNGQFVSGGAVGLNVQYFNNFMRVTGQPVFN